MFKAFLISILAISATGAVAQSSDWNKHFWLEKAARTLRNGHGLSAADNVEALMKMSKDDIVSEFMKDQRFADTVLDFNLYYLGFKLEDVREGADYNKQIFSYSTSSAVAAAIEAIQGHDYFKIFDQTGNLYPEPLPPFKGVNGERKKRYDAAVASLKKTAAFAAKSNDTKAVCAQMTANAKSLKDGWGKSLVPTRMQNDGPLIEIADGFLQACEARPERANLIARLNQAVAVSSTVFAELLKFESSNYHPRTIGEIKLLNMDYKAQGLTRPWLTIGFAPTVVLRNSSTNINRKRSAFVLKHYFCDDLTPVGVEDASGHTSTGPHGSDTSCFACHYKLDPMAGFFRNYGMRFTNFSTSQYITFDDEVVTDRAKYLENWKAAPGSGHEWNVGYVRSSRTPAINSYGESMTDLSRIIREAPEAKRCLSKRLFEYLVGEGQTIDAGYLADLTARLTSEGQSDSSVAFKNTIRRIVLSESFAQSNADPQKCYDYGPGEDPTTAPPCRVAYLLRKNCVQCHDSLGAEGFLDFSKWIDLKDGSKTFPHYDEVGEQYSAHDTLNMMAKRLTSNDASYRMPYKKDMASQERQELYMWVQQSLSEMAVVTLP